MLEKRHLRQPGVVISSVAPATSVGLLGRLKAARPDSSDWNRFEAMYVPLIRRWIGRIPGLSNEVDDLTQEVRLDFSQGTWDALRRFALEGQPAVDVAREPGISENTVIKAKSRVLSRLRQEASGFLE